MVKKDWKKVAELYFNEPLKLSVAEKSLCELMLRSNEEFASRLKKGFPELHKCFFEEKR